MNTKTCPAAGPPDASVVAPRITAAAASLRHRCTLPPVRIAGQEVLLVAVTDTGMLNVAPWQALSELFAISTLLEITKVRREFSRIGHDTLKVSSASDTPC
jgi:hypothetical protein